MKRFIQRQLRRVGIGCIMMLLAAVPLGTGFMLGRAYEQRRILALINDMLEEQQAMPRVPDTTPGEVWTK